MAILRTITCYVCGKQYTETQYGEGFPNWGIIQGLVNVETGEVGAEVCPEHNILVFKYLDKLKKENKNGMD